MIASWFQRVLSLPLGSAALAPMCDEREYHGGRGAVKEESCSVQSGLEAERDGKGYRGWLSGQNASCAS